MQKLNYKKIKPLRETLGLSTKDLATLISKHCNKKITGMSISYWERGLHIPNAENMLAICDFFKVSLDYFKKG